MSLLARLRPSAFRLGLGLASASAAVTTSCSDPVRDGAIEELGPESPNVPQGPDHRAGQPCLVCHSATGPASSSPFAVAGTVYTTSEGKTGAGGVEVRFIDTNKSSPKDKVVTSASGNFFVPVDRWSVTFPFRVALFDERGSAIGVMTTTVNREGSCNYCHRPPSAPSSLSPEERARRFYGPVYRTGGGS
jgi:hypothetical protein